MLIQGVGVHTVRNTGDAFSVPKARRDEKNLSQPVSSILFTSGCSKRSLKSKLWHAIAALPFVGWAGGVGHMGYQTISHQNQVVMHYEQQLQKLEGKNRVLNPQNINVANSKDFLIKTKLSNTTESADAVLQHFHNVSQAAQLYLNSQEYRANPDKAVDSTKPLALSQITTLAPLTPEQALLTQQFYWDLNTGEKNSGEAFAAWLKEVNPQKVPEETVLQAEKEIHVFQNRLIQWQNTMSQIQEEKEKDQKKDPVGFFRFMGTMLSIVPAMFLSFAAGDRARRIKEEEGPS